MRYRLLGQSGLRVSQLFLGTMTFGAAGGKGAVLEECRRMLDLYADAGGNVIDTASAYGESEAMLGELLGGRRDRFVVGTKYTLSRDASDPNAAGNHRKNLVLSLEQSLRRLRTDYIDLYWVHLWDRHTPLEETMRALDDAVCSGKVLYIGISDAPAWVVARANTLAEWRGWTSFAGLQVPYNLLKRDVERELLPMAEMLGMTVATWAPLAGGVLLGKNLRLEEAQETAALPPPQFGTREQTAVQAVQEVANELGHTPAQVAIAWLMARSQVVHPILGASTTMQLKDNLGACDVTLPDDVIRRLEAALDFAVGFPSDFIAATDGAVFGEVSSRVDGNWATHSRNR